MVAAGSVDTIVSPDAMSVYVRGDIDDVAADDLRAALVQGLQRRGSRLLVDLTGASTLDGLGLGAILAARDAAYDRQVVFVLRCAESAIAAQLASGDLRPTRRRAEH